MLCSPLLLKSETHFVNGPIQAHLRSACRVLDEEYMQVRAFWLEEEGYMWHLEYLLVGDSWLTAESVGLHSHPRLNNKGRRDTSKWSLALSQMKNWWREWAFLGPPPSKRNKNENIAAPEAFRPRNRNFMVELPLWDYKHEERYPSCSLFSAQKTFYSRENKDIDPMAEKTIKDCPLAGYLKSFLALLSLTERRFRCKKS